MGTLTSNKHTLLFLCICLSADSTSIISKDEDQAKYVPPKTQETAVAAAKTVCVETAKAAVSSALQVASTIVAEVGERGGMMLSGADRRGCRRMYIQGRILEARRLRALDEGLGKEYVDENIAIQASHHDRDEFEEARLMAPGLCKDIGNSTHGMVGLATSLRKCY